MKNLILLLTLATAFLVSCNNEEPDMEKPEISQNFESAFPLNCDTIYFGETFNLKLLLTDNIELGSMSIDIHNNFDHHSHSTEVSECSLGPIKTPINPITVIEEIDIPAALTTYSTDIPISLPASNESGNYDTGDYHLFISLTDKEGWSVQKGMSIKILYR